MLIMLSATLSLGLPPPPFMNYRVLADAVEFIELGATSALANMSQPVASDNDLMRINGVSPIHPSIPSPIFDSGRAIGVCWV